MFFIDKIRSWWLLKSTKVTATLWIYLFLINKIFGNYNLIKATLSMPYKSLS